MLLDPLDYKDYNDLLAGKEVESKGVKSKINSYHQGHDS